MLGNWKKVLLFILCFIFILYIINKLLPAPPDNTLEDTFPFNNLTNILNIPEKTVSKICQEISLFFNISSSLTSSENLYIISTFSFENIFIIFFIIRLLIIVPLSYSFTVSLMKFKRSQKINAFTFLENDNVQFKRAWSVTLRKFLALLLPIILLVIISLKVIFDYIDILRYLKLYVYFPHSTQPPYIRFIIELVLLLLIYIYYYTQKLKYILSFKIAFDNPNLSAKEVVKRSKTLMQGQRKKYFLLQLSFIGWRILASLTFGIGFIWLTPYTQISTIYFYSDLIENNTK